MKWPLILIGLILLTGCVPTENITANISQKLIISENKNVQAVTVVSDINQINQPKNNEKETNAIENALKSTVLIFSTNQLGMEMAKNNFWDGIELLKPILEERQVTNYPDIFRRSWKQGSGVIIDKNGYILTSRFVIEDCAYPCGDSLGTVGLGAQLIYVFVYEKGKLRLERGQEYIATVICKHPHDDLAIIKITPRNGDLPYAPLGDSSLLKKAQSVIALGYPMDILYAEAWSSYKWKSKILEFQCDPTTTSGIVSAKRKFDIYPINSTMEELNADYSVEVIQTDAAVNRGNTGGALIDNSGKVVGIGVGKLIYGEGLGFAIAINEAKEIVKVALARPIQGIPDGAFLSCEPGDPCYSQSAWESNPSRRCSQLCNNNYSSSYRELSKCLLQCDNNTRK